MTVPRLSLLLAHELKNPLSGLKALVQLGLRNPAESASHERLASIERVVARMESILRSSLSSEGSGSGKDVTSARADVELGALVEGTFAVLAAKAAGARVRLRSDGDATVRGDPRRLHSALSNLVSNAIEATSPGGEVAVEVHRGAGETEIVVRDTGRGMPPGVLRRLGTPFFTTRADGTGLGVALARSVVAMHGGELRFESEPGQGTTVRITLPEDAPHTDPACRSRAPSFDAGERRHEP